MQTYLLDTNAFSALMDEHPKMLARSAKLSTADRVLICAIVRGEIRYGLERMPPGRRQRDFSAKAADLFARTPCVDISETMSDIYGRIKRECERQGTALTENDLWIAACALNLQAVLVTSDSDFENVAGLSCEDWTQ